MNQDLFQSSRGLILLAAIVCASLFVNLGSIPLFDEDEGAYAEVTREMLHSGDWLTPRLHGAPFFHKPPLIYWTQAFWVRLLGLNEFALRLPSTLASLAWSLTIFWFVRRHVGHQAAWFAPFFLITALQTNIIARAALADALLNLFITLSMFSVYTYFKTGKQAFLLAMFGAMGLGFLSKGPIAVAIPLVVSALFCFFQKRLQDWIKVAFNPFGWLIFLIIALPWYAALCLIHGWDFVQEIFLTHNVGRFQNTMEGHSGPIFYYIPVILFGLLPFTTLLIQAFGKIQQQWNTDLGRFLILWFGFVLILFSLAGTKLHHYIVYGYVPLLIFMAQAVDRIKHAAFFLLPSTFFLLILLILPQIASWAQPYIRDDFAQLVISEAIGEFQGHFQIIIFSTLAAIVALGITKRICMQMKIVATGILFTALLSGFLVPKVAGIMQAPVKSAALLAREKGYKVVMWRMNYPSFSVYYDRSVEQRSPRCGDVIITKADNLDEINKHQVIYQKHGFVLTRVDRFQ